MANVIILLHLDSISKFPFSELLRKIYNADEARHWRHPDEGIDNQTKGEFNSWVTRTKEADNQAEAKMQADTSFVADKAAEKRNPNMTEDETQRHVCSRCDAKRSQEEVKQKQIEQQTIASNAHTRKSFENSDIEEDVADVQSKGYDQYKQSNNQVLSAGQLKQTKSFNRQHDWPNSGATSLDNARSYNQQQPGWFSKTRGFNNSPIGHADVDKVIDVDKTARNTNFNSFGRHGGANNRGISDGKLTQTRSFDSHNSWQKSNAVHSNNIDSRRSYDHYKYDQFTENTENEKGYKAQASDQDGQTSNFGPYINKRHVGLDEITRDFRGQNGWQKSDMRALDNTNTRSYDGQNEWHISKARASSQTDAARSHGQHEPGWSSENSNKARSVEGQSNWQKSDTRASDNINTRSFDGQNDWYKSETRTSSQTDAARSYEHQGPGWSSENSDKARSFEGQSSWQKTDTRASGNINTRSFDGQNEWHKSEGRTSSQTDAARSYGHHEPGWSSENSDKARSFEGQNGWQKSETEASDKIDAADTYTSRQTQWSSGHWKQGQGYDTRATDSVDTAHMKADDRKLADVRSSQGTQDKSFDGHNKWQNLDSRASDHVDTIRSYDSHHQPGWSSDKARGYDDRAFHHDYVNDADMTVAERSNRYGPYVQSKDRAQPTRSFDDQNEWHKSESRTADHVDAGRSYSHHDPGWSSGKARSFEGQHSWEKSGRMAAGNVETVRTFNQYHPGQSMDHYNGHYQQGWDYNNRDAKQIEMSSDSEGQLVRSDGYYGGWNQNDRRAAEEKELIHATSSTNKAVDSIDGMTNEANEDRSQHYHGEMNMISPTGSGHQPHLEWDADVQKYPGGDTHLQGQWQVHDSDMNSPGAHGNWGVSIHKDQQGNVAAAGTWNAETSSHGSGGMGQSDHGQNGRNPGQSGPQSNMSASSDIGQQNTDGAKTTDKTKTAARVEGQWQRKRRYQDM